MGNKLVRSIKYKQRCISLMVDAFEGFIGQVLLLVVGLVDFSDFLGSLKVFLNILVIFPEIFFNFGINIFNIWANHEIHIRIIQQSIKTGLRVIILIGFKKWMVKQFIPSDSFFLVNNKHLTYQVFGYWRNLRKSREGEFGIMDLFD